ncbi:hypothetical protein, partial [Caballeronia sp.]|uniref:hypothetical protein n=1 Tax=Caballeronia sp. TaxID=1931223 RepID=UPI003C466036
MNLSIGVWVKTRNLIDEKKLKFSRQWVGITFETALRLRIQRDKPSEKRDGLTFKVEIKRPTLTDSGR